jgi:fucose 4-O-acetylase-like acetyltransferase
MEEVIVKYDKNERIFLWDNLKVLLMMQVVVTHSVNVYQLNGYYWIQFLWVFIMSYTMPLFMIISGYFYKKRTFKYAIIHYLYPCILFSIINYLWGAVFWCLSQWHFSEIGLGYVVYMGFIFI